MTTVQKIDQFLSPLAQRLQDGLLPVQGSRVV